MKKIILILLLLIFSTKSHAIANFTRDSGVLLVPNVSVDGVTNFDSMTLQLDLGSGIFNVIDAIPKNGTFLNSTETAKYTGSSGMFVVPDVSVDGVTYFEEVTLQLDIANGDLTNQANGTFTITNATPKDISFSDVPLESLRLGGLKIDFLGCALSGLNQVSCKAKIISSATGSQSVLINQEGAIPGELDRAPPLSLFDNFGQGYRASFVSVLNQTDESLSTTLPQGIPTEVVLVYDNFDIHATSISTFKPDFLAGANNLGQFANIIHDSQRIIGDFRDIDF